MSLEYSTSPKTDWSCTRLEQETGFDFFTGVPDSEFKALIRGLETSGFGDAYIPGTREDNALGLAAGAYLAGKKPLVFMESSGVGTCIDALTSLVQVYRLPIVLFIAWAGYKGRDVPHHNAIGQCLEELLEALKIPAYHVPLQDTDAVFSMLGFAHGEACRLKTPIAVLGIPHSLCNS